MSNSVYGSRKNFSEGWVLASGRYARPGAIAEMYNTQLDLQAEGALRQAWGMVPIAFTGTIGYTNGQLLAATATGRRPGICSIETIKTGDEGEADTVIVATQEGGAGTLTTNFYHLTDPDTSTRLIQYPWGNTISNIKGMVDTTYTIWWHDFFMQQGIQEPHSIGDDFAATASATGACDIDNDSGFFTFKPTAGGSGTITLNIADSYTGETGTIKFAYEGVTTATRDVAAGDIYALSTVLWDLEDNPPARTVSFTYLKGSPRTYSEVVTWTLITGSSQGLFYYDDIPANTWSATTSTNAYFPVTSFANYLPNYAKWDSDSSSFYNKGVYSVQGGATELPYPTMTYHHILTCGPVPSNAGKSGRWSTAMKRVTTVADVSQPTTGPMGIWKAASMNGYAFWFNGYSGTAFKMDVDSPASTSTIGLDRPDASSMTLARYSDTGKGWPRGVVTYWMAWIDADGLETALSLESPSINNRNGNDYGVRISGIVGPTTASWSTRIYRSFRDRKDPYILVDLDYDVTTYDDRIKDEDLGDPPWTHGDKPPYDAFCPIVYYDRLWVLGTRPDVTGAERTTLFWSDINEPESFWWDGNWANVYADDGDRVTAMIRTREGLLIFKNNHTYLMSGRTPEEITFVEITVEDSDTGVGCPHSDAVIATDNGVFFYWNKGLYRYFQGQIVRVSEPVAPLLQGKAGYFDNTTFGQPAWEEGGIAFDWSATLGYDSVEEVLYVGLRGDFPLLGQGERSSVYDTDEVTLLFDVRFNRWIGMYTGQFGLQQRVNLKLWESWDVNNGNTDTSVENILLGAYLGPHSYQTKKPWGMGFSQFHPLAFLSNVTGWGGPPPRWFTKFRPVGGNTGPFILNRFLYVDYLISEAEEDFNAGGAAEYSQIKSRIHLDGQVAAAKTQGIQVGSNPSYSNLLRHNLGLVANEIEIDVEFDHLFSGDLYRLHEYSIGWQNMGRETAELPGKTSRTPPGGAGGTGLPKGLK